MKDPPKRGHSEVWMWAFGLVDAPAKTDLPTLEELYDVHFEDVWRVLARLGVADAALDDAVQDVFLVAHRKLGTFERRSSLKTWLVGIAIRVAKDYRRRQSRKGNLEVLPEDLPDPRASSPLDVVEKAEAARFLDRFLSILEEEQREVFVLAELEQMSAPQIAELTKVKLNTVYSRLRIAREKLERAIARRRAEEERSR